MELYEILIIALIFSLGSIYLYQPNLQTTQLVAGQPITEPTLQTKQESIEAFEYLNEKRAEYDRVPMTWDDNIYELSLYKSKDMFTQKYYDHKDPEGKCVESYANNFNVNKFGLFDDLSKIISPNNPNQTIKNEPKEAVDSWLNSRGHRYWALHPYNTKGAIACFHNYCTLIVQNNEDSACNTAEEGIQWWKTVSPRQYEI